MKNNKVSLLLLAVVLCGLSLASCRSKRGQGCPTFNSIQVNP